MFFEGMMEMLNDKVILLENDYVRFVINAILMAITI